jgi:hypothetical protein
MSMTITRPDEEIRDEEVITILSNTIESAGSAGVAEDELDRINQWCHSASISAALLTLAKEGSVTMRTRRGSERRRLWQRLRGPGVEQAA